MHSTAGSCRRCRNIDTAGDAEFTMDLWTTARPGARVQPSGHDKSGGMAPHGELVLGFARPTVSFVLFSLT